MKKRYVYVDTETGGLDPKHNGITEIAAIGFDFDPETCRVDNLVEWNRLIRPEPTLSYTPYALEIQDRTLQYLNRVGEDERIALVEFEGFVLSQLTLGHPNDYQNTLMAHYAQFDYDFIAEVNRRFDNRRFEDTIFRPGKRCEWLCTKNMFRMLYGLGIVAIGSSGLDDIVRYYGITVSGKVHNALTDARLGIEVFRHMVRDLKQYYGGKK